MTGYFDQDRTLFKNYYNPQIGFESAQKIANYFKGQKDVIDLKDNQTFLKFFREVQALESLLHSGEKLTLKTVQEKECETEDDLALRAKAVIEDYVGHSLTPDVLTIQALLHAYILIEKAESDKRFWAERKE